MHHRHTMAKSQKRGALILQPDTAAGAERLSGEQLLCPSLHVGLGNGTCAQ